MDYVNKWVSDNFFILKKRLKHIKTNDWSDIFQEVLIQFLTMDKQKSSRLINDGVAIKYIYGIFYINATQPTAPFKWKYNKIVFDKNFDLDNYDKEDTLNEDELCLADIEIALDDINEHFIYKLVYQNYIERKTEKVGYSMKKISEESDIPKSTLVVKFIELKDGVKKIIDKYEKE